MGLAWIGAVLTISGTQRSARPHNIYTEYFSKLGNTILGLSGWHSAMPCLVLCRLVLSCMAQNKSLPNMVVTVSNTDCNWFAQCPWAILIANVKWIFIFTENSWYVENYQKHRQINTMQDKTRWGGTQTRRCPLCPNSCRKCTTGSIYIVRPGNQSCAYNIQLIAIHSTRQQEWQRSLGLNTIVWL